MNKIQHSDDFPDSFHRVSVKGLCVQDDKIFLMKEPKELSGKWELPGGGLDFGESPKEGMKREIEEEMGIKVLSVSDHPLYTWTALFEGWRNMDWYYSVVLAYRVELEHFDYIPTEECEEAGFFNLEELQNLDLFLQSQKLREVFNPADFK